MGAKPKAKLIGGSLITKSFSLREDNRFEEPTHFSWTQNLVHDFGTIFYCDTGMSVRGKVNNGMKNVAILVEPKALHPENYLFIDKMYHYFDHVLTYDQETLDNIPNGLFYALGGSSIAFRDWGLFRKKKEICMICSDKFTTDGHKVRQVIARNFADDIDIYGAGVGKPFKRKFEILKDYKYCVVVESDDNNHYFSEKLVDACSVGCIPLTYLNRNHYACTFFKQHVFTDLNGLRDLLIMIRNNMLHFSIEDLQDNLDMAESYRIAEDYIFDHYQELFT